MDKYQVGPWACNDGYLSHGCPCGNRCFINGVDRASVRQNARMMARQSLRTVAAQGDRRLSVHFGSGFEQAYIDMAEGNQSTVPTPAQRKRAAPVLWVAGKYGSSEDWLNGYSMGSMMAEQAGMTHMERPMIVPGEVSHASHVEDEEVTTMKASPN